MFGPGYGDLPSTKKWKSRMLSSTDTSGGNHDFISVAPGESVKLGKIDGGGWISRMWFTLMCPDPDVYRKLIFKFYWDGEENPSVEAPYGDYFGMGFSEYSQHVSAIQGVTSGGWWSYRPMPFVEGAKLEAKNIGDVPISHLYFGIQYHEQKVAKDMPRFHAKWRRENPTSIGNNYTILEAKGKGHFTGCVLNMQSYDKGSRNMLEGDEAIWVDGDTEPSILGTGTEDYFQGGWYWQNGPFSAPYHGLSFADQLLCRFTAYRLHIPDPIPFEEKIRVTIEHCNCNMLSEDYSSTAYWYQQEPHDSEFGGIPNVDYVKPLGTKIEAYLMSEYVQDLPQNVERRKILSEAAQLRIQLMESKKKGVIPKELNGLKDEDFLRASYDELKKIVESVRNKREN
jgi:hypothetical protein